MSIKELIRRRKFVDVSEPTIARADHAAPDVVINDEELDDESLERIAGGANIAHHQWESVW